MYTEFVSKGRTKGYIMYKLVDNISKETVMTLTEAQHNVILKIREANTRMIHYQDQADLYRQAEHDEDMAKNYERWSEEMYTLCKGMLAAFRIMSEYDLSLPSALFDKIVES